MFVLAGQRWVSWTSLPVGPVLAVLFVSVGVRRGGEPASVAKVRRRSLWLVALPFSALVVVGVWGRVLALGTGGPWWPGVVGAVLVGSVLPQVYRSIRRWPVLALTTSGVRYRGQTTDAFLAWDDVAGVGLRRNPRGSVVTVAGRTGAASWSMQRRFWLCSLEWKPVGEHVDVEIHGTGDAELALVLTPWITEYWRSPTLRDELGTALADRRADDLRDRVVTAGG